MSVTCRFQCWSSVRRTATARASQLLHQWDLLTLVSLSKLGLLVGSLAFVLCRLVPSTSCLDTHAERAPRLVFDESKPSVCIFVTV